jgi:hypothetical protein
MADSPVGAFGSYPCAPYWAFQLQLLGSSLQADAPMAKPAAPIHFRESCVVVEAERSIPVWLQPVASGSCFNTSPKAILSPLFLEPALERAEKGCHPMPSHTLSIGFNASFHRGALCIPSTMG